MPENGLIIPSLGAEADLVLGYASELIAMVDQNGLLKIVAGFGIAATVVLKLIGFVNNPPDPNKVLEKLGK